MGEKKRKWQPEAQRTDSHICTDFGWFNKERFVPQAKQHKKVKGKIEITGYPYDFYLDDN